MMRMQTGLFCALAASLAFAVSCADSGTGDEGEEMEEGTQNVCGDATCAAAEVGFCAADCGTGGNSANNCNANGMCETTMGENASTCFTDCGGGNGSGSGSGSGSSTACPSDPIECFLCAAEATFCMPPLDQATCTACIGGGGGLSFCEGGAPDGTCNAGAGEDATTCADDCP